jgi:hypothetical protein
MRRFVVFVLLIAAMLAIEAPAWLVAQRVAADTDGWLELRAPHGTLWNGGAEAVVPPAAPGGGAVALGHVSWRVQRIDWRKALAEIDIVQTPPAPRPLRLVAGTDRRAISGALRAPAAVITRLPLLAGWSVGGGLTLEAEALEWSGRNGAGQATLLWQSAAIGPADLPESVALGDVTAWLKIDGSGATVSFANSGGTVALGGTGDTTSGRVELQIQPRADTAPAQVAWLKSHLPGDGRGGYAIRLTLPGSLAGR